jgi:hypothetical protein
MPISRLRLTCLAMCTLAVAAACSSSSAPGANVTIAEIAQHYDQIATNYSHGGATPSEIGGVIAAFNGGPANGAEPGAPQVITPNLQHGWLGNVIDLVDSTGTDSLQLVSFWFGGNIEAVLAIVMQNGVFAGAVAADTGSSFLQDSIGTGHLSLSALPGTCAYTQVINVSTPPTFDPSGATCSMVAGTFSTDTLLFPQADSSATAFTFAAPRVIPQRITGVRLQYTSEATFSSAVAHVLGRR